MRAADRCRPFPVCRVGGSRYGRLVFVHEIGSGAPVVLLHGFGLDHRFLLPLDPAIRAAGDWRRLYLDLPGSGQTPVGDVTSADDVVAAVVTTIRERLGAEPFAILGNSFGGMIARAVAHELRSQVLGLATLAGVFEPAHAARLVPERTVLHRDDAAVASLGADAAAFRELAVIESAAAVADFRQHVLPGIRDADEAALATIARDYAVSPVPEAGSAPFTRPSLHITARQDDVVGFRDAWATVEHYPRATFAVLDGAGHNVHLERPDLCAALVTDWLQRVRTIPGSPVHAS